MNWRTPFSISRRRLPGGFATALLAVMVCVIPAKGQNFSPWSEAVRVGPPISSPTGDACPFIAKNDLDLYFRSNRPGGYGGWDIYVSHRDSVDDPWEEPINLGPEINTAYTELCSFVTIDGHWLYFVSNRPGTCGGQDLWVSHRQDKRNDVGWETPKNLGCIVNSTASEVGPVIFEDDATGKALLYFTSNRPGGLGGNDTYVSQMVSEDHATFGPPSPVVEWNTAYSDFHAFVRRKDGLEAILVSNRPGGFGYQDLWVSTRPTTLAPWSVPVNLGPLVNCVDCWSGRPSISWDGTTLYFWTTPPRPGAEGYDIYRATRTKLPD